MTVTNPSDAFHQWMTLTLSNIKLQLIKLTGHSLNQVWVIIPTRHYFNLHILVTTKINTELKTIVVFAHPSGSLEDTSWVSLDPCSSLSIFSSDFVMFNKCCMHILERKWTFPISSLLFVTNINNALALEPQLNLATRSIARSQ